MSNHRLCGVVVTYVPTMKDLENLEKLRAQIDSLVVIDNGSPSGTKDRLKELSKGLDLVLVENPENLGIATAMNIGAKWALEHGHDIIIFFDQDSTPTPGMIYAMLACMLQDLSCKVGILVPRYQDSRTGRTLPAQYLQDGSLSFAMSSGSMVRMDTFRKEGWYVDELFIGGVDLDFSLRLRSRGYLLKECPTALLLHEPSYPKNHAIGGLTLFTTSNYSAIRRYYSERNRVWLRRRYRKQYPALCMELYWSSAKEYVKILLGEQYKYKKLRLMFLGALDGVAGRMGRSTRV